MHRLTVFGILVVCVASLGFAVTEPSSVQNEHRVRSRLADAILNALSKHHSLHVIDSSSPLDALLCDARAPEKWLPVLYVKPSGDPMCGADAEAFTRGIVADVPVGPLVAVRTEGSGRAQRTDSLVTITTVILRTGDVTLLAQECPTRIHALHILHSLASLVSLPNDIIERVRNRILDNTSLDIIRKCRDCDRLLADNETKPLDELLYDAVLAGIYPGPSFAGDCYEIRSAPWDLHAYIAQEGDHAHVSGVQVFREGELLYAVAITWQCSLSSHRTEDRMQRQGVECAVLRRAIEFCENDPDRKDWHRFVPPQRESTDNETELTDTAEDHQASEAK